MVGCVYIHAGHGNYCGSGSSNVVYLGRVAQLSLQLTQVGFLAPAALSWTDFELVGSEEGCS